MEKFKVGDVVILKSGGPKMTITQILTTERVRCKYFDGNGIISHTDLPMEALMTPPPDKKMGSISVPG